MLGYGVFVLASCAGACHAAGSMITSTKLDNAIVLRGFRFIDSSCEPLHALSRAGRSAIYVGINTISLYYWLQNLWLQACFRPRSWKQNSSESFHAKVFPGVLCVLCALA